MSLTKLAGGPYRRRSDAAGMSAKAGREAVDAASE